MVIDNYERIVVEKAHIPCGARLVEAYITKDNEVIVCGEPEEQPGEHDCDVMGCATLSHVIFRGHLTSQ